MFISQIRQNIPPNGGERDKVNIVKDLSLKHYLDNIFMEFFRETVFINQLFRQFVVRFESSDGF